MQHSKLTRAKMRVATLNVLADDYIKHGDYRHSPADLMQPGARTDALVRFIASLNAEVVGLQEVEQPLVNALDATGEWNTNYWSQKQNDPDGCLTLVKKSIKVDDFNTHYFNDDSGHVMQLLTIGKVLIANTHLKWELPYRVPQARELFARIGTAPHAILLGDYNDRKDEPVRGLAAEAGFSNVWGNKPTAYIANREGPAPLDLLAVRGLTARRLKVKIGKGFKLREIPSKRCPSDHTPVMAEITLP